jgi:hypothetical protein
VKFCLGGESNSQRHAKKQVRSVFADEPGEIVVATVYVYYVE